MANWRCKGAASGSGEPPASRAFFAELRVLLDASCSPSARSPRVPRPVMDARAISARACFCRAYNCLRRCRHRPYDCKHRWGAIRHSLPTSRPLTLRPRKLPVLRMLVLLLAHACRLGHSAAGNSAGGLCAAACYDRRAAHVSRPTRAVCSFCLAAACASNPDLNDEQLPGAAT